MRDTEQWQLLQLLRQLLDRVAALQPARADKGQQFLKGLVPLEAAGGYQPQNDGSQL
jgi:hypothetical protein